MTAAEGGGRAKEYCGGRGFDAALGGVDGGVGGSAPRCFTADADLAMDATRDMKGDNRLDNTTETRDSDSDIA